MKTCKFCGLLKIEEEFSTSQHNPLRELMPICVLCRKRQIENGVSQGRQIIPIRIGDYQRCRMDRIRGQADLIYRNGIFYLAVVVEVPEPSKYDPVGALGVDLGIVNLAVDSDGEVHTGQKVEKVRGKMATLRAGLQSTGTRSAHRHLERLGCKEQRFRRDVNHCISKHLVAKAKTHCRAIALEDLSGIRSQTRVRKAQRGRHSGWSFDQLRFFIEYKAPLAGVPVVLVNPRGTSHTCPKCNHNAKGNRPTRDTFKCVRCGCAGHADHIAAINIAARAAVNRPIVSDAFSEHLFPLGTSPHPSGVGD